MTTLRAIEKQLAALQARRRTGDDDPIENIIAAIPESALDALNENLLIALAYGEWQAGGGMANPKTFEEIKAALEAGGDGEQI